MAGKKYLYSMKRIKKVFVRIHIGLWILFILLAILQLSQENRDWPALTTAVILTSLIVFYSHFALLTRYSGFRKKGAYFLRLAGIITTGPLIYLLFHPR